MQKITIKLKLVDSEHVYSCIVYAYVDDANDVGILLPMHHICFVGNCIGIADFSYAHGCLDLYHQARDFIYYNFAEVSKSDEFLQLSQSQLLQVLLHFYTNLKVGLSG